MENYIIKNTHISDIKAGDTIRHNGEMRTVSGTDIKGDAFIGKTLFGDSYNLGVKQVEMVVFRLKKDMDRIEVLEYSIKTTTSLATKIHLEAELDKLMRK
jgi:hypothetical protein